MNARLIGSLVLVFCFSHIPFGHAQADTLPNTIIIKNHQFIPQQLNVPAGQKIKVTVINQDSTAEEFESFDLDREQVVEGNKQIIVFIGPLSPGKYGYWADYHKSSKGVIYAQ